MISSNLFSIGGHRCTVRANRSLLTDLVVVIVSELDDLHDDVSVTGVLAVCDALHCLIVILLSLGSDCNIKVIELGLDLLNESANEFGNVVLAFSINKQINDIVLGWLVIVIKGWVVGVLIFLAETSLEVLLLLVELFVKLLLELDEELHDLFLEESLLDSSDLLNDVVGFSDELVPGLGKSLLHLDLNVHEI